MAAVAASGLGPRLVSHAVVHVVLVLAYFLPGGLGWNRIEPWVLGLPFSAFVEMLLLPALIVINIAVLVRGFWETDRSVTTAVRHGASIVEAEENIQPGSVRTGDDDGGRA